MYRKNWKNRREEKTKQNFSRGCMPKYHHLQIWMHQGYTRAGVTHFSRHSIIAKSICSSVNTATYDDEPAMWRHQTQQLPWKRQMVKKGGGKHSPALLLLQEMAGWNKPRDTTFFLSLGLPIFLEKNLVSFLSLSLLMKGIITKTDYIHKTYNLDNSGTYSVCIYT